MSKNIIIGTAGHIDHGKSTLIKAMTGDDTDRLAEEKERGISIELGFSHLENEKTKEENLNLGIVDVPGHQKFVNKMLAAAGGIDLALIVIAADEGVMPQTKEHLSILDLLEVEKAVIAVNKIDLVSEEWLQLIEEDIKEQFADTFAEESEIIRVSAENNEGVEYLKNKLIHEAVQINECSNGELPYFPVDRSFSLSGKGTVVTGTLMRGRLESDKKMILYPQNKELKISSLENHGQEVSSLNSGSRVGANVKGLEKSEINTGDIIAEKGSLLTTRFYEGELKLLKDLSFTVKNGDRVHFHTAAAERTATLYIYGRDELLPGEKAYVKLKLDQELSLFYRQKFILRRFSPLETIGGGKLLEIDPPPRRKEDDSKVIRQLQSLETSDLKNALLEFIYQKENESVKIEYLKAKTAVKKHKLLELINELIKEKKVIELKAGRSFIHYRNFNNLKEETLKILKNYHQKYHLRLGIKKEELRSQLNFQLNKKEMNNFIEILKSRNELKERDNLISVSDFKIKLTKNEEKAKEKIINDFKSNLFTPPSREEIIKKYQKEELLVYLESNNYLLRLNKELDFYKDVFLEIEKLLKDYFKNHSKIELSEFRDLINSSRRYALPLLEKTDELKITERQGNKRFPGPKLKNN